MKARARNATVLTAASLIVATHALAAPPGETGVPLRIVTLNIRDGIGAPGSNPFNDFGDYITVLDQDGAGPNRGLAPDIMCFQEVDASSTGISDLIAFGQLNLPGYVGVSASGDGFNLNVTFVRPDIAILDSLNLNTPGPRNVVKLELGVPGAAKPLVIYNAHFKAFTNSSSIITRTNEANAMGDNVSFEVNFGGPNNDGQVNVIFTGDLNSNNNADGTLTGLFFTSINPVTPSGVLNLLVESLAGRTIAGLQSATHPSSGSRLDYICLDDELASVFDTDAPFGSFSQTELNTMGFVYYSTDDSGLRSNGNPVATNFPTDHRPVVFDVFLPRDPAQPFVSPSDVNEDGAINAEDLYAWENLFAQGSPPTPNEAPDIDCNRNIDLADRDVLRSSLRLGESGDLLTQ